MTEPLSLKSRILNAVIGICFGIATFLPALTLAMGIGFEIGTQSSSLNANADDFLLGYVCLLPSALVSLVGGILGGEIGHKNNRRFLGAAVGGLLGPIVTLIPLSIFILNSWSER